MHFPLSGVDCPVWLPPLAGFVISLITAPAGVSGAFVLLPFQFSVLHFTSPSVSATNLVYNIISTPGGVFGYARARRLAWPLAGVLAAGTLPGIWLGAVLRVKYLSRTGPFQVFAGCVLLLLGARLLYASVRTASRRLEMSNGPVTSAAFSGRRISYDMHGSRSSFDPVTVAAVALVVGVIGGIYGVGGGAMIAPFLVGVLGMPVQAVAGATLVTTLVTSVAGVLSFTVLGAAKANGSGAVRPDWVLGVLFGVGGLAGTYIGSRLHAHLPARWLVLLLACLALALGITYLGASIAARYWR